MRYTTTIELENKKHCDGCPFMYQTCCDSGPDYECYITKSGLDYDHSMAPKRSRYVLGKTTPSLRPDNCPLEESDVPYAEGFGETFPFQYIDKDTGERRVRFIANTKEAYYEAIRETHDVAL